MKPITKMLLIFFATSHLFVYSVRNESPSKGGLVPSDLDQLEGYVDGLETLITATNNSLSTIATNTGQTATNTATESTSTTVTLKNQGGANHDSSGITNWTHPLNITSSTTGNTFKLAENILFKPVNANLTSENAAIVINKDNVTIDMCGQTLYFDSSDLTMGLPAISGIHIKAGVKGTQIISSTNNHNYKGAIQGFTEYGIYLHGTSGTEITHVHIDNITCSSNNSGIHGEHIKLASITNSDCIQNTHASNDVYGIYLKDVSNITLDQVESIENYSVVNTYGIYLENAKRCVIKNSQTTLNYSTSTGSSGSAYGIYITSSGSATSSSNVIENCSADENYCTANAAIGTQEAVGIILTTNGATTTSNIIKKCVARRNTFTSSGGTDPTCYGIKLDNSGHNTVEACTTSNNTTTGIIDTLVPSTSFFTKNISYFNGSSNANYSVTFNKETGVDGPSMFAIKIITVHISDHIGLQSAMQGMSNIEIIA